MLFKLICNNKLPRLAKAILQKDMGGLSFPNFKLYKVDWENICPSLYKLNKTLVNVTRNKQSTLSMMTRTDE